MFFSFLVPISLTLTRHTAVQEFTECVIFKTHFAKRHENILLWKQCEPLWMAHIYCSVTSLVCSSAPANSRAWPSRSSLPRGNRPWCTVQQWSPAFNTCLGRTAIQQNLSRPPWECVFIPTFILLTSVLENIICTIFSWQLTIFYLLYKIRRN